MTSPIARTLPRLLGAVALLVVLSACRLDVTVDVAMQPDGTGVVTVDAVADAELIAKVPGLADDLRLDDAIANGWVVEGPTQQADGATSIRLTHAFRTADDLASILNSIGPPLVDMRAARTTASAASSVPGVEAGTTTNAVAGTLALAAGYESFADADLLSAVGGLPFADEITASGLTPAQAMSVRLRVQLPGELISAETGVEVDGGAIEWTAPLDGAQTAILIETVQRPAGAGSGWARPVATISRTALIAWLVIATGVIAFVAVARRSKRRRRARALRNLTR